VDTFQEQQEFFKAQWPAMKEAVENTGATGVVKLIEGFDSDLERRVLYVHARGGLVMGDWEGKSFDPYFEVCDAGIAELLAQAAAADDDETHKAREHAAHVISFNLAADLADCWPGDDAPRTPAHFERGLKAADDCLGWCDPANSQGLSIDWWVRGMHQLSLDRPTDAHESWLRSQEYAVEAAREEGSPAEVSSAAGFGVILASGYIGLAAAASGDATGADRLDDALAAFKLQLADDDKRDDAQFGIDQLEKVRDKYIA
jgi:hypothetical protein